MNLKRMWMMRVSAEVRAAAGNAYITLETTTVQGGLQALSMSYYNTYSPYISEASMICSALPGCPNDWTAAGVRILNLSLHGDPDFAEKAYVILESNGGAQNGIVYYPEPNELRQGSWEYYRFWAIDLAQFTHKVLI